MTILKYLYYKNFCNKIINEHIDYKRTKHNDRKILESVIFPYVLAKYNPQKILDIGREDYQLFYNEFFKDRELWTLDYDPKRKKFGAKSPKHITDSAINLKKHFKDEQLDLIIMNGVFGWGLDEKDDVQKCFSAIFEILKPGGFFILGYNSEIVPLSEIDGLKKMEKVIFQPLKKHQFTCDNGNHTYNFFQKK